MFVESRRTRLFCTRKQRKTIYDEDNEISPSVFHIDSILTVKLISTNFNRKVDGWTWLDLWSKASAVPWIPFDVLAFDEDQFPDFAEFGSSLAVQVKHHRYHWICALLIVY